MLSFNSSIFQSSSFHFRNLRRVCYGWTTPNRGVFSSTVRLGCFVAFETGCGATNPASARMLTFAPLFYFNYYYLYYLIYQFEFTCFLLMVFLLLCWLFHKAFHWDVCVPSTECHCVSIMTLLWIINANQFAGDTYCLYVRFLTCALEYSEAYEINVEYMIQT